MFLSPEWLWLLVAVAALLVAYVVVQVRRKTYVARFSNLELLSSVTPRRPGWRRHLTFALLFVGLIVLTIGVAQPAGSVKVPRDRATVMMAIDVSLSMEATDVLPSRIRAAKDAASNFADLLPSRINLGLVSFGGTADVQTGPTLDRDIVKRDIQALQLRESTAIGEAVFSCLQAIQVFQSSTTPKGEKAPPARIVLLSDGSNNTGRTIEQAAAAAKKANVTVSTIAFGTDSGTLQAPDGTTQAVPADKVALKRLADLTGGSAHTAASEQELESVYKNIGSQIGYTTQHRDISWRFLASGLLFVLAAAGASMLWAGRLV